MRNGSLNYLTEGGGALGYSAKCCARKSTAMT